MKNRGGTLEERFWAKVDKGSDGGCWLWVGAKQPEGYGQIAIGDGTRRLAYAHRLSFQWDNPSLGIDGLMIDHVCHVRACVNPSHLRLATCKQNAENLPKNDRRGTWFNKQSQRWVAEIKHNGERIYLGSFDTREAAAEVARLKRQELFTHNDSDREVVA